MRDAAPDRYLSSLSETWRKKLTRINAIGLTVLRDVLENGEAVAFLGAGVSAPLYPLWDGVVSELIGCAADLLTQEEASTCRAMAATSPDAVVEIVRQRLGRAQYEEVLRQVFQERRDPVTGRTWTPTQELVARCNFAGVVTTNYDSGVVNARMAVRPNASGTGFASWNEDGRLDRWRRGEVFGDDELPVLYAHGHHRQPEAIVLATTEYRRAYAGKLAKVLGALVDTGRLVWIGFSFADQRIGAILDEIAEGSGTRIEPGQAPRHVALMPWDPAEAGGALEAHDPGVLRRLSEIQHAAHVVLYPALAGDHSSLQMLLEDHADPRFPAPRPIALPRPATKPQTAGASAEVPRGLSDDGLSGGEMSREHRWMERWVHGGAPVEHFTGREDELARLERWATTRSGWSG